MDLTKLGGIAGLLDGLGIRHAHFGDHNYLIDTSKGSTIYGHPRSRLDQLHTGYSERRLLLDPSCMLCLTPCSAIDARY